VKLLIINSRYFPSAGPEKYLFNVTRLFEAHGHEVIPFALKNKRNVATPYARYFADNLGRGDDLYYEEMDKSIATRLQLLERQFYSFHVKHKLEQLLKDVKPDLAYVLHHQNRLSPSVLSACRNHSVPTVVRISDFSLVCTRNNLLRSGEPCELCLDRGVRQGVIHKCVKDDYVASAIKAAALVYFRVSGIYRDVHRYIFPSRFTMTKLSGVLPGEKLIYVPTLISADFKRAAKLGTYALFVGRVEEEKGLIHAIKALARTNYPLKVVGYSHTGYGELLRRYVRDHSIRNVEFLGPKFGHELEELYENCRCVIIPAIWYENLPNVALEAMQHGKPVISSSIGSLREVVLDEETGLLFEPGNSDACLAALQRVFENDEFCRLLGQRGYERAVSYYSAEKHYDRLQGIFTEVMEGA